MAKHFSSDEATDDKSGNAEAKNEIGDSDRGMLGEGGPLPPRRMVGAAREGQTDSWYRDRPATPTPFSHEAPPPFHARTRARATATHQRVGLYDSSPSLGRRLWGPRGYA